MLRPILTNEALVLAHQELRLYLAQRIQYDTNDDNEAAAGDAERGGADRRWS